MQSATADPSSDFFPVSVSVQGNHVLMNFSGATYPFAGARSIINFNVPEPTSAMILTTGGLMLISRRRRD
jgi:hypothetical protein